MILTKELILVVMFWFFGKGISLKCYDCDDDMNCDKDSKCTTEDRACAMMYCSKDGKKQPPTEKDYKAAGGYCSAQSDKTKNTSYCGEPDGDFQFCVRCYCFADNCNEPEKPLPVAPTTPPPTTTTKKPVSNSSMPASGPQTGSGPNITDKVSTAKTPAASSPTGPGPSTTAPAPSQPAGTAGMSPGKVLVGAMVIAVIMALESE